MNPKIIKGRFTKDFGYGFYCTIKEEQAKRWSLKSVARGSLRSPQPPQRPRKFPDTSVSLNE